MPQAERTDKTEILKLSHQLVELYDKISSWEHSVIQGSGLSPTQMHAIEVIGLRRDMRMKELAERLGVTTGTLTVAVDKLEKKGFVVRTPHQHDRRSWLVTLTTKGQMIFSQHDRFHRDFTEDISAGLSSSEVTQLTTMLSKLLNRM